MTEFRVEVVRLGPCEKHPNADKLQVTNVHGGYPCISQLGAFKQGDLAVYIPINAMVPASHPAFSFLVPEPVRKKDVNDIEWAERLRRYKKEKTELVRIKARRLRGIFSMGLLVPLSEAFPKGVGNAPALHEGDDVQALLGIEKYEPDESNRRGGRASGPQGPGGESESCSFHFPEYTDVEGYRRWTQVLQEGEEVVITEKIHGQNARYIWREDDSYLTGGRLWAGSRHQVKRAPRTVTEADLKAYEREDRIWQLKHKLHCFARRLRQMMSVIFSVDIELPPEGARPSKPHDVPETNWWKVARTHDLATKLAQRPGYIFFGEVYGPVQDLKYGSPDDLRFRCFDVMGPAGHYVDHDLAVALCQELGIETVPVLYRGPWNDACRELAEGQSTLPGAENVREGFVVRPTRERSHPRLGRVLLKLVGQGYLLR